MDDTHTLRGVQQHIKFGSCHLLEAYLKTADKF